MNNTISKYTFINTVTKIFTMYRYVNIDCSLSHRHIHVHTVDPQAHTCTCTCTQTQRCRHKDIQTDRQTDRQTHTSSELKSINLVSRFICEIDSSSSS